MKLNLYIKNKKWKIKDELVHVGGRVEKFEFKNEDWYKNWMQKIRKQEKRVYHFKNDKPFSLSFDD